jgi:hypothetical protein
VPALERETFNIYFKEITMSNLSIRTSKFYKKQSMRGVKEVTLGDDVIGWIYPVSSHEDFSRGIFQLANKDSIQDPCNLDLIAVEISFGQYGYDLWKDAVGDSLPFYYMHGSVEPQVFTSMKEARKFVRDCVGTKELMHNSLVSCILTEIRGRADRFLQTQKVD